MLGCPIHCFKTSTVGGDMNYLVVYDKPCLVSDWDVWEERHVSRLRGETHYILYCPKGVDPVKKFKDNPLHEGFNILSITKI